MQNNLELTVLRHILTDEDYMRKVLPFIRPDYFNGVYRSLFKEAGKFVAKYNKLPNHESFKVEIDDSNSFSDEQYKQVVELLPDLFSKEKM